MAFIDYYKTLGVSKKATEKEIKKAYRKLARQHHPDLNANDKYAELKFKEINEANEVLSNAESRKKYDKYGEDWKHSEEFERRKQQQQSQGQQRTSQGSSQDYSDFFESMFGGSSSGFRGGNARYRGQDFNADLNLDLHDVYTSHKRTLTVNGKNIRLTIPAGVHNGQVIKIKGHGGQGANGAPSGDLNIQFTIDNHSNFKRDKDNLYATVDLDLYTSILGGEITIETFEGRVKLKVKPETQNGTKVKLKGKGFPIYKKEGQFGDLYITFNVVTPTDLTVEEKELFQKLSKLREI